MNDFIVAVGMILRLFGWMLQLAGIALCLMLVSPFILIACAIDFAVAAWHAPSA